jgi:hypothetical protein
MSFTQDLKDGENIELEVLALIQKSYPHAIKEVGKFHREFYDILIPKSENNSEIKIEVKADLYKSKNLAFECMGRGGKSTGIIKTSSNYWVHYRTNRFIFWETKKLKRYLLNLGNFMKNCGDDKASAAWVVPEDKIIKECVPFLIVNRGDSVKIKL